MYDVCIIGAGAAGLSAALWCDELGLETLLLEEASEVGGQLLRVYNRIDNHLGARADDGRALRDVFAAQVEEAEFDLWTGVQIDRVDLAAKKIHLRGGEELPSICLVIATGVRRRKLGVPGEDELAGRGMIESATRDRELFAGRDVCVVGGGDAAAENALLLAEVCPTVTLVHRGARLRAREEFAAKLRDDYRITVFLESSVRRVIGETQVEGVEIYRAGAIKSFEMAVGGVLVRVGVEPNTELFRDQLETNADGYINVSPARETSVAQVFAIGDVANPLSPTVSGAVGDGATVAKIIGARLSQR